VLARVLASKQADQALGLLEPLHALAVVQGRVSSVIELLGLRAIGLEAVGDQHRALAALAEALRLAYPQGYVRVFVDEGPPMAALFASCWRAGGWSGSRQRWPTPSRTAT
jgi:LuxR family maltose regulon positive regulatory protein